MRVFLLGLWLDLREKRLAPVASLLLAGIVAVPIVLADRAELDHLADHLDPGYECLEGGQRSACNR
jgi:hypothetical protein